MGNPIWGKPSFNMTTCSEHNLKPMSTVPEEKILQPEFAALARCLKDAIIKTGQIYGFYADVHKLKIENYVPNPPQALTAALGRDIEKYDQLCDSVEAHLLRAINVLKRDLRREEERIEAEERRKNVEVSMLPPPLPHSLPEGMADGIQTPIETTRNSPLSTIPGRRPSAISISSLHRPQFPPKLDLSSPSLRITEEEAALFSKGLASPVTLAPKSARPMDTAEFSGELMAAFATSSVPLEVGHSAGNMTLTLPKAHKQPDIANLDVGVGDSSDKPIELDLDAMDMDMANLTDQFGVHTDPGESSNAHDGLFSPLADDVEVQQLPTDDHLQSNKNEGNALFQIDSNVDDELFGNFTSPEDLEVDLSASSGTMSQPQTTSIPSPESLLAQLSSSSGVMDVKPSSPTGNPSNHDPVASFDLGPIDLTHLDPNLNFFSNPQDAEMGFSMEMTAFMDSASGSNVGHGVEEPKLSMKG